jgi:hypothetical protein
MMVPLLVPAHPELKAIIVSGPYLISIVRAHERI